MHAFEKVVERGLALRLIIYPEEVPKSSYRSCINFVHAVFSRLFTAELALVLRRREIARSAAAELNRVPKRGQKPLSPIFGSQKDEFRGSIYDFVGIVKNAGLAFYLHKRCFVYRLFQVSGGHQ